MDEPETALSPRTQVELVQLLAHGCSARAQFVIATHSPILLACPGATLYGFDGDRISPMRYQDTDQLRVYREFLADPKRFLSGSGGA